MARILKVNPNRPEPSVIAEAAALIQSGGLVAFPTETVYGLGANALDPIAIARTFDAKGRPGYNPLIVHVADATAARVVVREWPARAAALAEAFWPGPLTLVLVKDSSIPDVVTAGLPTVGVRVPSHPVAQALLRAADRPIAAPSANLFMGLSPTAADHVSAVLRERVDLVLDAGPASVGIESTVVDLTTSVPTILRPGVIDAAQLAQIIGEVRAAVDPTDATAARPSPGMLARHYAPRADLVIVETTRLQREADARRVATGGAGVIMHSGRELPVGPHVVRLPGDARGYARLLYATLHAFDQAGLPVVIVERVPNSPDWDGVRDRLSRAAHPDG